MTRSSIQAGKAVILVDVVDRASASFRGITNKITQISKGLSNLGTNAAGGAFLSGFAVKGIINNFISFEDKILNLTAKLGYFGIASKKQDMIMKDLVKTIVELGMVTSYSSSQVADAAISLAQAGFSVDELKGSLKGVLDLARGTGYSLGETADLMANTIRTFNLFSESDSYEQKMEKVNYLSSMFVKATRLGTIEIVDLRESLKYAGGTANNLGASIATVLGLLVQTSEAGLKASLAGTSMGTAFLNLIQNLDKLQERVPGFQMFVEEIQRGLDGEITGGSIDFEKTFSSLEVALSQMDKITKTKLIQDVFNIRGGRFLASIMGEMANVRKFKEEIAGAGNESQLAAATMESGLGGALRRTTSAFEALNIAVGYVFKDSGKAFLNFTTILVERLKSVVDQHKGFIALLILSPGILAATAVGALGLSFALNRIVQVLRLAKPLVSSVGFLGSSISGGLGTLNDIIGGSAKAKAAKIAAYKKSQEAVFKAQIAVDQAFAAAAAKKSATAQANAMARVMSGKKMQTLISATMKMQQARTAAGMGPSIFARFAPSKLLAGYGRMGKNAKALTSGSIAAAYQMMGMPFMSAKEMWIGLNNIVKGIKAGGVMIAGAISSARKNIAPYLIKLTADFSNRLTGSKSIAGTKGIFQYFKQVRSGLATGHVPNILNTQKLTSSMSLLKGSSLAKMFTGFASGARTIGTLAMSFTRLSMSLGRFIFSWNFVGLAINALLLFGNRIPVIANAFKALGDGLGSAFGELGKIATYAGPAIKVFTLAFQAFQDGNGELGMQALAAGFSGLVDIIQNQLTAAWNAFLEKTMHIWNFFNQIWVIVKNIGAALFEGIVQNFGMLFGSLTEKLGPIAELFTGGGGNIAAVISGIATGIIAAINFISSLFVKLQYWTDSFISSLKMAFGDIIDNIPGTGSAGATIKQNAINDDLSAQARRNDALFAIKNGGDAQQKEIIDALKTSAEELSAVARQNKDSANSRSQQTSNRLLDSAAYIEQVLAQNAAQRQAQQDLLASQQMQQGTRNSSPGGGLGEAAKMFQFKLDSVVSSIQNVNNKALKDTSTQLEEQQTTNKKLDQLISVVKTQGM